MMLPSDQPSKSWGSHHNFTTLLGHLSQMQKTKQSWGSLLSVLVLILLKKFSLVVNFFASAEFTMTKSESTAKLAAEVTAKM